MVLLCSCEGFLGNPQGTTVSCTNCHRSYPLKDAQQIMKLLRLSGRELDNDGKPANEHVRRVALNKAAYKIAALKLRVMDEEDLQLPAAVAAPPPPPRYYRQPVTYTATYSGVGNSAVGNVYVHVTW